MFQIGTGRESPTLTGDDDDIGVWYTVGGDPNAWSKPERFQEFFDNLLLAAESMELRAPSDVELIERIEAETINETWKVFKDETWGEDLNVYLGTYSNMSRSDRRKWRNENPDLYSFYITDYYNARDEFGKANQLWSRYFNPFTFEE